MNREMKCRAWHKDEGKFLEVNKLYICDGAVMCVQDINEYEQEIDPPLDVNDKNLALVWYTGLSDTHNREIYEGDILNIKSPKGSFRAEVVNSIGTYGVIAGRGQICDYFPDNWNDDYLTLLDIYWNNNDDDDMLESVEIVGNRYENPELLKEEPTC